MFTYFLNTRISLQDTTSYHVFNLVIHALAALFIFPVLRRLLEWAGIAELERTPWAVFGAVLFLLHPLQTESVAYISGRSDALSGMLAIASFGLYVNRPAAAITWGRAAAVLALFAAASLAKEQAIVLPALFLLTDLWWNPESLVRATRANWRLYAILPAGAVAGLAIFWKSILGIGTGGAACSLTGGSTRSWHWGPPAAWRSSGS